MLSLFLSILFFSFFYFGAVATVFPYFIFLASYCLLTRKLMVIFVILYYCVCVIYL